MAHLSKKVILGTVAAIAVTAYFVHKKHPSNEAPPISADQQKCYGAALKGQNDCAARDGSHSCAGQAKADCSPDEWKLVKKGTCPDAIRKCIDKAMGPAPTAPVQKPASHAQKPATPHPEKAPQAGEQKCYGAALKGKNDCAARDGSHSCAGQAKANCRPVDWKIVKKGACPKAISTCIDKAMGPPPAAPANAAKATPKKA